MHCHLVEYWKQGQQKTGQSSTMDLCIPKSVLLSCSSAATYLKAFLIELHRVLTLEVFHKYCKMMYIKRAQMYTIYTLRSSKGEGKFLGQLTFPVVSMLFFHHERKGRRGVANWRTFSLTNERPGCGNAWAKYVVFLCACSAFASHRSVAKRFICWTDK